MLRYDPTNQATWKFHEPPPKPEWFERGLVEIAGLNPQGKPKLRLVWGGTEMSDRSHIPTLKYPAGYAPVEVPGYRWKDDNGEWQFSTNIDDLDPKYMVTPEIKLEHLGALLWIVEKWTSPEELEEQKRFVTLGDEQGQVLRDFPREGVYDAFFIVQNLDSEYRELDRLVLDIIAQKWKQSQKSFEEQESERIYAQIKNQEAEEQRMADLWAAAFAGDLKLEKDELERREHYWATKQDYDKEIARYAGTATFYQP